MDGAIQKIILPSLLSLLTRPMFNQILSSVVWFFALKTETDIDDKIARQIDAHLKIKDN